MSTSSKLTLDQMKELRARSASGESQRELALAFGIHKRTVGRIIKLSEDYLLEQDARRCRYKPRAIKAPRVAVEAKDEPVAAEAPKARKAWHIRYGTAVPTAEGSYIQRDPEGRIVRILSCPVYDGRQRFVARYDVSITVMNPKETRANGVISEWSGGRVRGKLFLEYSGPRVKRVEFYPRRMPEAYMKRDRELREKAASSA